MKTSTQPFLANTAYDVATAISIGRRDCQEDAIVADFPQGSEHGFVVLADGMGGHAAGDVASRIVVSEVFSELKLQSGDTGRFEREITSILRQAAQAANACVLSHATSFPRTNGMGATLLAPVLLGNRLHWISVGDSPLFLYRDGRLRQINEDHSLAPQIDHMVRSGLMPEERGRNHPDRNCLTSVLIGLEIPRVDCPAKPLELREGDIVIAASDGLQFLDDDRISDIVKAHRSDTSSAIAAALMAGIQHLADPEQDNVALAVIRVYDPSGGGVAPRGAERAGVKPVPVLAKPDTGFDRVTVMASRSGSGVAMMCRVSPAAGRRI